MDSQPKDNQNPYASPSDDITSAKPAPLPGYFADSDNRAKWLKTNLLISAYALFSVMQLLAIYTPSRRLLGIVIGVMFVSALIGWCITDARIEGKPILHSLYWIVFFTWPVAVPICLMRSRGIRGLGLAALHAFGLIGTATLVVIAVRYLVWLSNK